MVQIEGTENLSPECVNTSASRHKNETMKAIFILDDEKYVAEKIRHLFADKEIEIIHARSVERGVRLANELANRTNHVLAILDMMLPMTERALHQHETIMEERNHIVASLSRRGEHLSANESELWKLRKCDARLSSQVSPDGGIQFLENMKERIQGWKIIVHSASSLERIRLMIPDGIQVYQCVEVPCDPEVIFGMVDEFICDSRHA